jgi:hypothetical protein
MHRFDRVVDGYGQQYAADMHSTAETVVVRPLHPKGQVGEPLLHPRDLLQPNGEVYLRHNLTTWFVTDTLPALAERRKRSVA